MTRVYLALFIGIVWPLAGTLTWYNVPGTMRNGQPFDAKARTCAVDATWWDADKDAPIYNLLTICVNNGATNPRNIDASTEGREPYDQCTDVAILDTGWLAPYGIVVDCTQAVWKTLGIPLAVGRQEVVVYEQLQPQSESSN